MKKWLVILMVLISLQLAKGNYVRQFYHYNEDNQEVTNIERIGWRCVPYNSTECADVDRNIPFTIDPTPVESGSTNYIEYEETAASQSINPEYFIQYVYTEGYQAYKLIPQHSAYSGDPVVDPAGPYEITLTKKDNCRAEFTYSIQSCAEQGLPISILTDTELNAETASAFTPSGVYWPPELDDWRNISTTMKADIKPDGLSQSVPDYPKFQTKKIYAGTTEVFSFLWETTKNTVPGNYIVTMRSSVPDEKCDQNTMEPVEISYSVYVAESPDTCVCQIQGFSATDIGDVGEQMYLTGSHLNSYQDWNLTGENCDMTGELNIENSYVFAPAYKMTIEYNGVTEEYRGSFQENEDPTTYRSFSFPFTPSQYGHHVATLTLESTGDTSTCEEGTTQSTAVTEFDVGHDNDLDGYYDLEGDCNDNNEYIYPGNENPYCTCDGTFQTYEECDEWDNNCNGRNNEGLTDCAVYHEYYCDKDNDGHYSASTTETCEITETECIERNMGCLTEPGDDCDDNNSSNGCEFSL